MRPTFLFLAAAALFATVSPAPAQTPAPAATPAAVASPAPAKLTRAEKRAQKKAAQEAAAATPAAAPVTTTPAATAPAPAAAASPAPTKTTRAEKKAAKAEKAAEIANATPAPGGGPGMVWVNTKSHVYHDSTSRWYGKTKTGKYMTEKDAIAEGDKAHKEKEKTKTPAAAN